MMKQATIDQLKAMKFTAMAKAFESQTADPATYGQMGFEERFGLLVDAEWNRRQQNKLRSRIQEARLDTPSATMEGIEYLEDRQLDRAMLMRLASCAYSKYSPSGVSASRFSQSYVSASLYIVFLPSPILISIPFCTILFSILAADEELVPVIRSTSCRAISSFVARCARIISSAV